LEKRIGFLKSPGFHTVFNQGRMDPKSPNWKGLPKILGKNENLSLPINLGKEDNPG